MRLKALTAVLIGLSVLFLAGCASTRQATSSHSEQLRTERVETVEKTDSVIVEQRDTLREVTTITIDRNRRTSERRGQAGLDYPEREGGKPKVNDRGDTLKLVQVTDRSSIRDRDRFKVQNSRLMIKTDTVYIEKRDSSLQVKAYGLQEDPSARSGQATVSSKLSAVSKILKWIFWILIGLIGLTITVKVCLRRR